MLISFFVSPICLSSTQRPYFVSLSVSSSLLSIFEHGQLGYGKRAYGPLSYCSNLPEEKELGDREKLESNKIREW